MIELAMPADAPDTALDEIRKVIRKHRHPLGERVTITVGDRRIELGYLYTVTGTTECLTDLMRAIPEC